jgi:hypothetical protein
MNSTNLFSGARRIFGKVALCSIATAGLWLLSPHGTKISAQPADFSLMFAYSYYSDAGTGIPRHDFVLLDEAKPHLLVQAPSDGVLKNMPEKLAFTFNEELASLFEGLENYKLFLKVHRDSSYSVRILTECWKFKLHFSNIGILVDADKKSRSKNAEETEKEFIIRFDDYVAGNLINYKSPLDDIHQRTFSAKE